MDTIKTYSALRAQWPEALLIKSVVGDEWKNKWELKWVNDGTVTWKLCVDMENAVEEDSLSELKIVLESKFEREKEESLQQHTNRF